MNSVWQNVTLATLPLHQWRGASLLNTPVGLLRSWRQSSVLMQWSDVIAAALLTVVFALAPLVPSGLIGLLLGASILFWVLLTISDDVKDDVQPGLTPIHLLVMVYWGVAAIAAGFSPLKPLAFLGLGKLSLYLLFFVFMARVLRSPKIRTWVIGVFLHTAVVVSVYGMRQFFFGADATATWVDPTSPTANTVRVYSFLGNPNLLAAYLLPAIALSTAAFFAWQRKLPKALAVVMIVVNTACMVLTQSRGGWIGFALMVMAFVVLLKYWWNPILPRFWRLFALPLFFASLAGVVVLGIIAVPQFRYRVASIFEGSRDSSNAFRMNVWAAVIDMIKSRPVLGFGPGDGVFKKAYPVFARARFSALSAYSILLEVAVESGFIGLTAFLWLLFVIFHQGVVQLRRLRELGNQDGFWLIGAVAALVGMLGHGTVDTVWFRPEVNVLWWLSVAMIASFYTYQQKLTSQEESEDLTAST